MMADSGPHRFVDTSKGCGCKSDGGTRVKTQNCTTPEMGPELKANTPERVSSGVKFWLAR